MSKINSFLDFTGLSELARIAIRELFPNIGKYEAIRVRVCDQKYPQFRRNKKR